MKSIRVICVVTVALTGSVGGLGQVAPPETREAVLEGVRAVVEAEVTSIDALLEGVVAHPFHARMDAVAGTSTGLARIAERLSPDGTMQMGGRRFLLFDGRRLGAGEYLSVEYEGRTYEVQVVEITASSYTLRMNDEEIERNL
jgi:hypothetical protein